MNAREFLNLQDAYQDVYQKLDEVVYGGAQKKPAAPADTRMTVTAIDKKGNTKAYQNYKAGDKRYKAADHMEEEVVEEGLRSAVKRLLGGGKKEAEAPKPESRGAQLRKKYNVGPEKSDTSAKRQILDRSRAKAEKDEKEFGGSKYSKSVAQKSKAAHDRYLKAGYSKYGADDARGSGNKARKRAAALNREEFEIIVDALIEEGYDLSSYTWDEMYDICLDEAVEGLNEIDSSIIARTAHKRMQNLSTAQEKENSARDAGASMGERSKAAAKVSDADAKVSKHRALSTAHARSRKRMKDAGQNVQDSYEYDIFDSILEYLVAEGYADTNESALVIMANMSEEWRQSIVEVKLDPRGRPASGPMNVYANPKGKPDQAHLDAVKSVRDADAKKTPEQRKAELDAYRERQMNNK
jgi:hypothetical protein